MRLPGRRRRCHRRLFGRRLGCALPVIDNKLKETRLEIQLIVLLHLIQKQMIIV